MGSTEKKICCAVESWEVLTDLGWRFSITYGAAMTALSDIQKALNLVRSIEKSSNADVRLDALALVTATASEIAKDLRHQKAPKAKVKQQVPQLPIPKPKQTAVQQPPQTAPTAPKPFTEPERAERE